ncbi:uncharacterized protein LOC115210247, partial [Argonauta hians]
QIICQTLIFFIFFSVGLKSAAWQFTQSINMPSTNTQPAMESESGGDKENLESILKAAYRMHKHLIKSTNDAWKEKYIKLNIDKKQILASRKSLQEECDALRRKNTSLTKNRHFLNSNGDCENCKLLQQSVLKLTESHQKIIKEKDELIKHLSNQLAESCSNLSNYSISSHLGSEKHEQTRLKMVPKVEQEEVLSPTENKCSNQNNGKYFVPDTLENTLVGNNFPKDSYLTNNDNHKLPVTLVSDSESDCDLGDNQKKGLDCQKLQHSRTRRLKKCSNNYNVCQNDLKEDNFEHNSDIVVERSNSPTFTSKRKVVSSNVPKMSPVLLSSPERISTSTPPSKKRTLRSLTMSPNTEENSPKTDLPKESSPSFSMTPSQMYNNSKKTCFNLSKKPKIDTKTFCSPIDLDKTVPPEKWNNSIIVSQPEKNSMLLESSPQLNEDKTQSKNDDRSKKMVEDSPHNGSLAPSMCMTEFLLENEELNNGNTEKMVSRNPSSEDKTHIEKPDFIIPSDSYKFGDDKIEIMRNSDNNDTVSTANNKEYKPPDSLDGNISILNSFDRPPQEEELPYAYDVVVRKKQQRKLLNGYTCHECVKYYKAKGLSDEEIKKQVGDCSKHRAKYKPPNTPDHFWSIGFPDTEECEKRGYFTREQEKLVSKNQKTKKELKKKKKKKTDNEEYGLTQMLEYLEKDDEAD